MAAPNSAYRSEVIHDGTTIANSAKGLIAIPSAEEAVLKARFYLDWVMAFEKDGVRGFIGGVTHLSDNYYMHNTARHYTLRGRGPAGQLIYWFNDAGLNTLGLAAINSTVVSWANHVILDISFFSSWHNNSTGIGIRFRVGSGSWSINNFPGAPPKEQSVTSERTFITPYSPGQNMEVQAFITNEEGTYHAPSQFVLLGDNINQFEAFFRSTPCESGTATRSVWLTETMYNDLDTVPEGSAAITEVWFYKDVKLTIPADSGWYYGIQENKSFFVASDGMVQQYVVCTPPSTGTLVLGLEVDAGGFLMGIQAFINPQYGANLTISGRIDTDPFNATIDGIPFTINIAAGQSGGYQSLIGMLDPNKDWYWVGISGVPSGYDLITQDIF